MTRTGSAARVRRPVLIVMVKTPRPGRVKTRLARDLGAVGAAGWQRRQTARLLRRLGADPRFETWLAVAPDADAADARLWPPGLRRIPQGAGDLGARMARALRAAAPRPAVLVGSDIPGIEPRHVIEAFRALGRAEAVFGPATDGGYWLLGLRGRALAGAERRLRAVRWSTSDALTDTEDGFRDFRRARASPLRDVDSAEDILSLTRRNQETS